jgi:predicted anti-sigma-YlaC factor YlaD
MLNCKQVAQLASDYLDQESSIRLTWQIRMHLLMCANCRRFVRHLRITRNIAGKIESDAVDAEGILKKIKIKEQSPKDNSVSDNK